MRAFRVALLPGDGTVPGRVISSAETLGTADWPGAPWAWKKEGGDMAGTEVAEAESRSCRAGGPQEGLSGRPGEEMSGQGSSRVTAPSSHLQVSVWLMDCKETRHGR